MRTIVLADLHLVRQTPPAVVADLVQLVTEHAGARLVFAGDLLDLSADPDGGLAAHRSLVAALARHVDQGGELWIVAGNHDAAVGRASSAIADLLGVTREARSRIRTTPWFFRDGALHVEHGHLYDPDNATAHPLYAGDSLGVHFVEEFIVPTGAHRYLNANDGTPLHMFVSAFRWYGVRAPYVVYRFFRAAFAALAKSGPFYAGPRERDEGTAALDAFVNSAGIEAAEVARLADLSAKPTLESLRATFARLYLDRVGATIALAGGAAALATGRTQLGSAILAGGSATMLASWAAGHDRYQGSVSERLARAAAGIVELGTARLVVFGHTHAEALGDAYANTGSFSFPRGAPGRPFLEIEGTSSAPRAVRRYVTAPRG